MTYDNRRSPRADVIWQTHRYSVPASSTGDEDREYETEYDDPWPARLPSSSRRYTLTTQQDHTRYALHPTQMQRSPIPARRSALPPAGRQTEGQLLEPPCRRSSGVFRSSARGGACIRTM